MLDLKFSECQILSGVGTVIEGRPQLHPTCLSVPLPTAHNNSYFCVLGSANQDQGHRLERGKKNLLQPSTVF